MFKKGQKVRSVGLKWLEDGTRGTIMQDSYTPIVRWQISYGYMSKTDCHTMSPEHIVYEEIYNSKLYKLMRED